MPTAVRIRRQKPAPPPLLPLTQVPGHVAIIMDGNGRWAQQRGRPRLAGHRAGTENLRRVIERFADYGVTCLTLYAFSTENWNRPKREVRGLMTILRHVIKRETKHLHKNGIRLLHIGDLAALDERLQEDVRASIDLTKDNDRMTLAIAFNYGGRAEIVDAVKQIVEKGIPAESIDEDMVASHLSTDGLPDPDLIIRTAGEMRLSNFLLWQGAYAEFCFTPVYWPDFDIDQIDETLLAYGQRTRRFGGLPEHELDGRAPNANGARGQRPKRPQALAFSMLLQRVLTALVGIPVILALILIGDVAFTVAVAVVLALASLEFFSATDPENALPGHPRLRSTVRRMHEQRLPAYLGAAAIAGLVAAVDIGFDEWTGALALAVAGVFLFLIVRGDPESGLRDWLWIIGGVAYVGFLGSHLVLVRELDSDGNWAILAIFATFAADTTAYLIGRPFGRTRITPNISPGKTLEGSLGGFAGGFVAVLALNWITGLEIDILEIAGLAMLLPVVAMIGDLAESLIKRGGGVKDAGDLVPGHGGLLDRLG